MKEVAFFSSILTGYGAVTLGIIKVLWLQFGVHFYSTEFAHAPVAPLELDILLIAILIIGGLCLVMVRAVVVALVCVIAVSLFEFFVLHPGPHEFMQTFLLGMLPVGQTMTLFFVLADYFERKEQGRHSRA